jgi:hypothetical protein
MNETIETSLTRGLLGEAKKSFAVVDLWRVLLAVGPADELKKPVYLVRVLEAMAEGGLAMTLSGVKFLTNLSSSGAGRVVVLGSLEKIFEAVKNGIKDLEKSKSGLYSVAALFFNVGCGIGEAGRRGVGSALLEVLEKTGLWGIIRKDDEAKKLMEGKVFKLIKEEVGHDQISAFLKNN